MLVEEMIIACLSLLINPSILAAKPLLQRPDNVMPKSLLLFSPIVAGSNSPTYVFLQLFWFQHCPLSSTAHQNLCCGRWSANPAIWANLEFDLPIIRYDDVVLRAWCFTRVFFRWISTEPWESFTYSQHQWGRMFEVFSTPFGGSINGGSPKWMVYNGKSYQNVWFRGNPILGNLHFEAVNLWPLWTFGLATKKAWWWLTTPIQNRLTAGFFKEIRKKNVIPFRIDQLYHTTRFGMTSAATELPKVARGLQRGIAEMLPRGCGINQWPGSIEKKCRERYGTCDHGWLLLMYVST